MGVRILSCSKCHGPVSSFCSVPSTVLGITYVLITEILLNAWAMKEQWETLCMARTGTQGLGSPVLIHQLVPGNDQNRWSPIWPPWSDMHGGQQDGVYWLGAALGHWGQKATIPGTRKHYWGLKKVYLEAGTYNALGEFSMCTPYLVCVGSGMSLFKSQMP